ncbi:MULTISPECIES: SAM-dependent methyltransferase [Polymorphospora]|uniref:SAM-dependent methyltransferase n=1 Tax=Polymorphospora lycopeni TaxID=3140240 RepID=A0ABV5D1W2_9ACTN
MAPPGVDITVAHSARMYDWWLGGTDNFAVDRAVGAAFAEAIPDIRTMARENRRFLDRVVDHLVREAGVRQFLDIGSGIPTSPNLHEVAQRNVPDARVVYVDNDPIVLAHSRALIGDAGAGATEYIHADLRDPASILADPVLARTLDLDRPVALMLVAMLMLIADEDDPWGTSRELMDALPPGSYVVVTHPGQDFDPAAMAKVVEAAGRGGMTLVPRTRTEVERFFGDWELVEPGVVPVLAWRPDGPPPADPNAAYYWAGVARKPG